MYNTIKFFFLISGYIIIIIISVLVSYISYYFSLDYKARKLIDKYKEIYPNLTGELLCYLKSNVKYSNSSSMEEAFDLLLTKKSVNNFLSDYMDLLSGLLLTEYDMFNFNALDYRLKAYESIGSIFMNFNIEENIKNDRKELLINGLSLNSFNFEENRKTYKDLLIILERAKLNGINEKNRKKLQECITIFFELIKVAKIHINKPIKNDFDKINIKIKTQKELIEKGL